MTTSTTTNPTNALTLTCARHETPAGALLVVVDDAGAVRASGFTDDLGALLALARLDVDTESVRTTADLGAVSAAVRAYAAGDLAALDAVRVAQHSGPFTEAAWDALRRVAPGTTVTYTDLARLAGRPAAVRAAAAACASNRVAPFVPCHRVLRTGGALGGYRWSLETKRALLHHESPAR